MALPRWRLRNARYSPFGVRSALQRRDLDAVLRGEAGRGRRRRPVRLEAGRDRRPVQDLFEIALTLGNAHDAHGQAPRRAVGFDRRLRRQPMRAQLRADDLADLVGQPRQPSGGQFLTADLQQQLAIHPPRPLRLRRRLTGAPAWRDRRLRRRRAASLDVPLRDADRELADAEDEGGPLGDADAVAGVEDVEQVRALQGVLERRPDQPGLEQRRGELEIAFEQVAVKRAELRARNLHLPEHVLRLLDFLAQPDLGVFHAGRPLEVVDAVDPLQDHRDALEAVGELGRDRRELQAAGLLKVGELRDLHAVEHHLPADAPGAERRRLPVVFLEADVMLARVDAAGLEAVEIELLDLVRRGLENHLELMVLEQPVRVLAESSVGRPPRGLHVGDVPVSGAEHAQKRLGVHRPGTDLDVERLLQRAAARGPEFGQLENQTLECHGHGRPEGLHYNRAGVVQTFRSAFISASPATPAPTSDPSPSAC